MNKQSPFTLTRVRCRQVTNSDKASMFRIEVLTYCEEAYKKNF